MTTRDEEFDEIKANNLRITTLLKKVTDENITLKEQIQELERDVQDLRTKKAQLAGDLKTKDAHLADVENRLREASVNLDLLRFN